MKNWKDTLIKRTCPLISVMQMLNEVALQIAIVVDDDGCLLGTVTDGDLRRGLLSGRDMTSTVDLVMNTKPFISSFTQNRDDIIDAMQARDLQHVPLVDKQNRVIGLFTIDEILRNEKLPNWAIIMAGGVGSRLHPLTKNSPKPLLNIGERPILETIISHLKKSGFSNIMLSVNYKAEMIKNYFGDGDQFGVHIEYLNETKPLGTAGALGLIDKKHPLLQQSILLMNGDVLTEMDFSRIIHFNDSESAFATMCIREYFNEIPFGVVRLEGHKLMALEEKPIQSFFINAGVYALAPRVLEYIQPDHHCDITDIFNRALEDKRNVTAYPITEYWRDIGTPDDFNQAQQDYQKVFGKNGE